MSFNTKVFLPGISVDCVVFGFNENKLKVLLLKHKASVKWTLPGGFIKKEENAENAVVRVLKERTQLDDIFLQQYHLFSDVNRVNKEFAKQLYDQSLIDNPTKKWLSKRFVTIGYYALVDFSNVIAKPDYFSEACDWHDLTSLPQLSLDHSNIIKKALDTLRIQLSLKPVGKNLLPNKFTMPELQILYETILGKSLDRRNFQRKMLSYGFLIKLDERRKGGAHKAPFLYQFDKNVYKKALVNGLRIGW